MERQCISSGKPTEAVIGYSRAVRVGSHVWIAGTTGPLPREHPDAPGDAYAQAKHAIGIIEKALGEAGATLDDVVRTRVFLTDIDRDADAVGRAHLEAFGNAMPASAFIGCTSLVGGESVLEIEADAYVDDGCC